MRIFLMRKFLVKPEIYYGRDSLYYLNDVKGDKACIVTEKIMLDLGFVDRITNILDDKNIKYEIFPESIPNPPTGLVTKGLHHIIKTKPDLLIAIGGGSSIDLAKAIMIFCIKTKEQIIDPENLKKPWFVAIPTTSGTGSEVTSYSVITDEKDHRKLVLIDDRMIPNVAILDSQFIKSVPPNVTADTGMDVLAHAIEAYISNKASDFTDVYAEKAIKIVFDCLIKCYKNGDDEETRQKMHNASCMAGLAFNNASLGINHSLAHALGSKYGLPHGKSNAILMPYVIRYNSGVNDNDVQDLKNAEKYASIAKFIGLPAATIKEGVISLCEAIKFLNRNLNIPVTIKEAGVSKILFEESLEEMVEDALKDICTSGNPKQANKSDLKQLFEQAYAS